MKYKDCSVMCSKGCGRERRPGQRYCRECHAKVQEEIRQQQNGEDAAKTVQGALERVVHKRTGRRKMDPALKQRLEALAAQVVAQIDTFNGVRNEAAA